MSIATPVLLASASPRRRQILALLGIPYEVGISPIDEDAVQQTFEGPVEGTAQWLAEQKAIGAHTLAEAEGHFIITADTTVLLNGTLLGKPRDPTHARELLLSLRGRWHHVITGVSVSRKSGDRLELYSASCTTPVLMRTYSEEEITTYIASGDPLDKAGAYGIQHPQFQPTESIAGFYFNVVGLPLCTLVDLLAKFDIYPAAREHREGSCPWSERCKIITTRSRTIPMDRTI